jgi:hypothetical protein
MWWAGKGRRLPRSGTCPPIMRHVLAAIKAPIFLGGPIPLITPRLKIRLGALRQEHAPCGFEVGARLVERSRGAALMFAGMGPRLKPAAPAPRVGIGWVARADRDRADAHVAVVDQPGLLMGVRVAAAYEGGHAPLRRDLGQVVGAFA